MLFGIRAKEAAFKMTITHIIRNGVLYDANRVPMPEASRAFGVITDTMSDAAVHPCTGRMMDSKSAFRRTTREHGCVEIGTEKVSPGQRYEPTRHEIESSVARAMERMGG